MTARYSFVSGLTLIVLAPLTIKAETGIILGTCHYEATYVEDFSDFKVSAWDMGNRGWTSHTPWAGDFGDASFSDPSPGFPFQVKSRKLSIIARKDALGKWQSGLISSTDGKMVGFSQKYGYFEASIKLPQGSGVWPAFWLASNTLRGAKQVSVEIDVMEHYGNAPERFQSAIHIWRQPPNQNYATSTIVNVDPGSLYTTYHTYGVDVEPKQITYYFDRKVTWRVNTPIEHERPLTILADLALGSGFSIANVPNPSIMSIAYVKVFKKLSGCED